MFCHHTTRRKSAAGCLFIKLSLRGLLTAGVVAAGPAHSQAVRAPLTIERLVASPSLAGTSPTALAWSPNSRWLAFLWNAEARPAREIWLVHRDSLTPRRITAPGEGISSFMWSPHGTSLIIRKGEAITRIGLDGSLQNSVAQGVGGASDVRQSPDGKVISWLNDGDLWMAPVDGGTATRLTSVGVPPIAAIPLGTYYAPDVEIGAGIWGGPSYTWSPDGRHIALHQVDRRNVRKVPFPYYLGGEAVLNMLRRSYPGDTNEVRRVGLLNVSTKNIQWLDLPDGANHRVVTLEWSPSGQLLIDQESDDAIDRWLHIASADGEVQRVWRDSRDTRIYNDIASTWHVDGKRIVMTSDLGDRYRLYAITPGDTVARALTSEESDVAGVAVSNRATNSIFYVSNAERPSERHVYRIASRGGSATRLTTIPGVHAPNVSPDGQMLALVSSDDVSPPELFLTSGVAAQAPRRITRSPSAEFAQHPWIRARYVSFPASDGPYTLHARIVEPPNLDRSRKYPVLFGPVYSNTVRNRWGGLNGMVQQMMAIEKGYITVQVDVRGSTGYGREFREKFLMDWGGSDLNDLEAAVNYMKGLPYVDASRLGIWGSSYGGTLTVYSLLKKPGLFTAGVAGAPATDPFTFGSDDVAIARRPQTHPETFKRGAAQYAANLRDHLLIIHGMQDDVVPFRTSVDLAEELMRQGKTFDFAFAPAATHGWTQRPYYARYLLQRMVDHFDRYMGGGPR